MPNDGTVELGIIKRLIENAKEERHTNSEVAMQSARDAMLRARLGKYREQELESTNLVGFLLNGIGKHGDAINTIEECVLRYNIYQLTGNEIIHFTDLASELAFGYFRIAQYNEALKTLQHVLDVVNMYKLSEQYKVPCLMRMGVANTYIDNYDLAREYFTEALKVCEQNQWIEQINTIYVNLGENYFRTGNYPEAINLYTQAAEYFKSTDNPKLCVALSSLAAIKLELLQYKEAEELCLLAEQTANKYSDIHCLMRVYKNLAELYLGTKRFEESIVTAKKALTLANETNNKFEQVLIQRTLGRACFEMKDFQHAHHHFSAALELAERIQSKNQSAILYSDLALCYANLNKMPKAKLHAQIALDEAKSINAPQLIDYAVHTLDLLNSLNYPSAN